MSDHRGRPAPPIGRRCGWPVRRSLRGTASVALKFAPGYATPALSPESDRRGDHRGDGGVSAGLLSRARREVLVVDAGAPPMPGLASARLHLPRRRPPAELLAAGAPRGRPDRQRSLPTTRRDTTPNTLPVLTGTGCESVGLKTFAGCRWDSSDVAEDHAQRPADHREPDCVRRA